MKWLSLVILAPLLLGSVAEAAPTRVIVRVKAKDAKFIGSTMGALVIVRESDTGAVLAKGFTTGGTGNTDKIMAEPMRRGASMADEATAKFEATVEITEPTLVTVEVRAPYGQRQSMTTNTSQVWLIPGKDLSGDGIVVEIYGFSVGILSPQPHDTMKLTGGKVSVPIRANVVMMCGCPISPKGVWDANKYEVKAIVKRNGTVSQTIPLSFANKASTFDAMLEITHEGAYEVTVYAFDPLTGNAGVDKTIVIIEK